MKDKNYLMPYVMIFNIFYPYMLNYYNTCETCLGFDNMANAQDIIIIFKEGT